MDYALADKVCLIIGGTSGIGLATAEQCILAGAKVIIVGRDFNKGQKAQQNLGHNAKFIAGDITEEMAIKSLIDDVVDEFGRIDCAINCAACLITNQLLHQTNSTDAKQLIDSDVYAQFMCMKYQIAAMLKSGSGTIVNVSSINGLSGTFAAALYSAGRHALIGLTRSAALEYITQNIRINVVCPGATNTPRRQQRLNQLSREKQAENVAQTIAAIPIGRIASAKEIANAILWLSSELSSYVVGHCLIVDGGLSA